MSSFALGFYLMLSFAWAGTMASIVLDLASEKRVWLKLLTIASYVNLFVAWAQSFADWSKDF